MQNQYNVLAKLNSLNLPKELKKEIENYLNSDDFENKTTWLNQKGYSLLESCNIALFDRIPLQYISKINTDITKGI